MNPEETIASIKEGVAKLLTVVDPKDIVYTPQAFQKLTYDEMKALSEAWPELKVEASFTRIGGAIWIDGVFVLVNTDYGVIPAPDPNPFK